jgi:hypothetical protein
MGDQQQKRTNCGHENEDRKADGAGEQCFISGRLCPCRWPDRRNILQGQNINMPTSMM